MNAPLPKLSSKRPWRRVRSRATRHTSRAPLPRRHVQRARRAHGGRGVQRRDGERADVGAGGRQAASAAAAPALAHGTPARPPGGAPAARRRSGGLDARRAEAERDFRPAAHLDGGHRGQLHLVAFITAGAKPARHGVRDGDDASGRDAGARRSGGRARNG